MADEQQKDRFEAWYMKPWKNFHFKPSFWGDDGTMRECMAEMMGTFILCVFGMGAAAQQLFTGSQDPWLGYLGWGLGCMFGIYWAAGVSGGHLNPAVTLGMCVTGRTPWKKYIPYTFFQTSGAFWACWMVYIIYWDQFHNFAGEARTIKGATATASIFATFPPEHVRNVIAAIDQAAVSAFFVGTVHALTDERNAAPGANLAPLLIGLLVTACGACFGINAGAAINPARDFGARMFMSCVGYGFMDPWIHHGFWGVFATAPMMLGGLYGGIMYDLNVTVHADDDDDKEKSE